MDMIHVIKKVIAFKNLPKINAFNIEILEDYDICFYQNNIINDININYTICIKIKNKDFLEEMTNYNAFLLNVIEKSFIIKNAILKDVKYNEDYIELQFIAQKIEYFF